MLDRYYSMQFCTKFDALQLLFGISQLNPRYRELGGCALYRASTLELLK